MNNYTNTLKLVFDPFEPGAHSHDFWGGADRQDLLDRIVEHVLYGSPIISVYGGLGAGKTTLANWCCERFGEESVCAMVAATLFMNQSQFMEKLVEQLPINNPPAGLLAVSTAIQQLASHLELEAKPLILVIDDAHELNSEVFETISDLLGNGNIHALLMGEKQLGNLLDNTLTAELAGKLIEFELLDLGSEDTIEYIRFKFASAGYTAAIPVSGSKLGNIANSSNGIPGSINALMAAALSENLAQPQVEPMGKGGMRYWVTAAVLVVLLASVLILPESDTPENARSQEGTLQLSGERIQIPVAATLNDSSDGALDRALTLVAHPPTVEIIEELKLGVAVSSPATTTALDQPITAAVQQSLNQTSPKVLSTTTQKTMDSRIAAPSFSGISDFESELLRYPANNFTVQIMGSRSEASVREFVRGEVNIGKPGYFETRFQDRPWFVVVLGNFGERHEAVEAIEELPEALRSLKPWIRSLADVQSDIRKLHASN